MGIHIIKMPDIGEGIAEVELVGWHVKVGDTVAEDQPLADVMTDKATVEIPSPVVGKVISLGGDVGQVMAVGGELIRLEVEGEGNVKAGAAPAAKAAVPAAGGIAADGAQRAGGPSLVESGVVTPGVVTPATATPAKSSTSASASGSAPASARSPAGRQSGGAPAAVRQPGEKPLASPAVRKRAWDLGVELRYVQGSGPAGRILHEDLDAWLQGQGSASSARAGSAYAERNDEDAVPVIGLRRKIAQKMAESKRRIPHFSYVEEIDVTELEDLRVQLNAKWGESRGKLTLLPLLARAMVVRCAIFRRSTRATTTRPGW